MKMSRKLKRHITTAIVGIGVAVCAGPAYADRIGGTITSTRVLTSNSELVSNVTCTVTGAPCLAFGASGISLKLNGFSISGNADAVTGCAPQGSVTGLEIGIDVNTQRGVIIEGPGIVQQFRGHGIRLFRSTLVLVRLVTLSTNCFAGIIVTSGSDNDLEENISVRNGNASAACGGI